MARTKTKVKNAKRVKRHGWSKDDVRELKRLAKDKTAAAKIARVFKKTEGAVRQKALRLGISLNTGLRGRAVKRRG